MEPVSVAVPRKGQSVEAMLGRFACGAPEDVAAAAVDAVSTLRCEKPSRKGRRRSRPTCTNGSPATATPEHRTRPISRSSGRSGWDAPPHHFDSLAVPFGDREVRLVSRAEPFRALPKHVFALGFDSAGLVLEEVVTLTDEPLRTLGE